MYRSPFLLAGIPSYVPLAELGSGRILRGHSARAEFPQVLAARPAIGGFAKQKWISSTPDTSPQEVLPLS